MAIACKRFLTLKILCLVGDELANELEISGNINKIALKSFAFQTFYKKYFFKKCSAFEI